MTPTKLYVMNLAQAFASQIMAKVQVNLPSDPTLADKACADLVRMQWELAKSYYYVAIAAYGSDDPATGWPPVPGAAAASPSVLGQLGSVGSAGGAMELAKQFAPFVLPLLEKQGAIGVAIASILRLVLGVPAATPAKAFTGVAAFDAAPVATWGSSEPEPATEPAPIPLAGAAPLIALRP